MSEVTVQCDRCGALVYGLETERGTSGFYRVAAEPWEPYARPGERVLCDGCMWEDPGYQRDYAPKKKVKPWQDQTCNG